MNILILGAGLVGGPMALDLAANGEFEVTLADINLNRLKAISSQAPNIKAVCQDLTNHPCLLKMAEKHDLILNAVPGFMGFSTLKTIIAAKKPIVDIAFFPEDPFLLNEQAKKHNIPVLVDFGVAPGMSHVLTGYAVNQFDEVSEIIIYVGGLPQIRQWPYEYKAVFSPIDVIEEYTRPARYIENNHLVTRPALSDPELLNFPGIGTLEAFNSDGLRTLLHTLKIPNIKEKTLRYPGHIALMAALRETGFFSKEAIDIKGNKISPLDFTAELLFPKWKLQDGEADITVMQVKISGNKNGKPQAITYDLLDHYHPQTNIHSMARTTGYTATAAVRMIAAGLFTDTGIIAPEMVGKYPQCTEFLLQKLAERGIQYHCTWQ
jgi:saccharopine dehydrogenase-like NADP-dependent oxidoreductase